MSESLLARQPIYTRDMEVHAYELLYRGSDDEHADVRDGDLATSQVLVNALLEIGLDELVGDRPAYINCTAHYLLEGLPAPMAPAQVVLEVLEDVIPDGDLLAAITNLREQGYTIVLDDFIYDESKRALVELADVVKLDVLAIPDDQLALQHQRLRAFGVKLLAEKVETQEEFERCKRLGFDYFQGYFFCRPRVIKGSHTPSSKMAIMRLLARLQDPALEFHELEELISHDVSLSYRIMRYVRSAHFGLGARVESIHQSVNLLGLERIKTWVAILAMAGIDDKPYELMLTALVRGRMAELLAPSAALSANSAFTVGLFSILDALMDMPLPRVLGNLPLADEVNTALLEHGGDLGELLELVLAYEQGDWTRALGSNFDTATLRDSYLDALRWAGQISASMVSAG